MKKIEVNTKERKYTIHLGCGALNEAATVVDELCKSKSVFIITDSGMPDKWVNKLAEQLGRPPVIVFERHHNRIVAKPSALHHPADLRRGIMPVS